MTHITPEWLDRLFERHQTRIDDYGRAVQIKFWREHWELSDSQYPVTPHALEFMERYPDPDDPRVDEWAEEE